MQLTQGSSAETTYLGYLENLSPWLTVFLFSFFFFLLKILIVMVCVFCFKLPHILFGGGRI